MNAVFNTLTHSYLGGGYGVIPTSAQILIFPNHTADKPYQQRLVRFCFLLNYND